MSFPRHGGYNDSGVEWLGEVPSHWKVERLKLSVESCRNGIWGQEADGGADDIICVRVADFDRVRLGVELKEPTIRSVSERERGGRLLRTGDLLLEKSGGGEKQPVGAVVLYGQPEAAVCSNFVARMRLAPAMHPRFWTYVHSAAYAVRLNDRSINQTSGIQNLDQAAYLEERAPYPPTGEQAAIADFLDRETAKIDALVEAQRRLIALLKEKRQAVISHAVTKGLDPSAPLKPSNIPWLGDVPAHWEVASLKRYVTVLPGYAFPSNGFSQNTAETPLLRGVNVAAGRTRWDDVAYWRRADGDALDAWQLRTGDVVLGMDRPWITDGLRVALLTERDVPSLLLQRVAAFRSRSALVPEYLVRLLELHAFHHHCAPEMTGVSVPHISPEQIGEYAVPLPPPGEQVRILGAVREFNEDAERLSREADRAINLFTERRVALISAAVTGKIDVRGLVSVPKTAEAA